MKQFLSLYKKEFYAFFASNIIYFLFALYLLFSGIITFYFGSYFMLEDVSLNSFFRYQIYLLILIVPAVTMRAWAEEKKSGTIELLMSFPLPKFSIVFAKFFASFSVLCLMLFSTIPFWIYSSTVMTLDNAVIFSSYFGLVLLGLSLCAIGCFVSSLTSSVVFAYLSCILISWGFFAADFDFILKPIVYLAPDVYIILQGCLNLERHLNAFFEGFVSLDDFVYFICLAGIFVFSTQFYLENTKDKKNILNGIYFVSLFLVFVFINIFMTLFFAEHTVDLTSDKKYKLSSATTEIINELPKKVEIKLFISENIRDYSTQYAEYVNYVMNRLFEYENISHRKIEVDIRAVRNYATSEKEAKDNNILSFITPEGNATVYFGAVFSDDSGKSYVIPNFIEQRKPLLESDISRILYKFSHPNLKKIGWIDGARTDDFSDVRDLLENDYDVEIVGSKIFSTLPTYDAIVVPNFQDSSIFLTYALDQYLLRGGKILLFADNLNEYQKTMKDLSIYSLEFLKNLNLRFSETQVIVDENLASSLVVDDIKGNKRIIYDVLNLNLRAENINQENSITKGLGYLNFISPSLITKTDKNSELEVSSLLHTSAGAGSINVGIARVAISEYVANYYEKDKTEYDLAYLVQGTAPSIFEKNIFGVAGYDREDVIGFIQYAVEPFKVIAVADTGVLKLNGFELQGEEFNYYMITEANDNLRFVTRSVDYLSGNEQLLGIENTISLRNYETLFSKISKEVKSEKIDALETVRKEIYANDFKIKHLKAERENLSLAKLKDIEALNQSNISLNEQLKKFEYQIISEIDSKISAIVLFWLVFYPLLFVLILFLLMKICNRIKVRKIKELFDENENL